MKDKELKLEEIETLHTLGGSGEGRVLERGNGRGSLLVIIKRENES